MRSFIGRLFWVSAPPTAPKIEPPMSKSSLLFNLRDINTIAVDEAFEALGYLNDSAKTTVVELLADALTIGSSAASTTYRKTGEQLSKEMKRTLGIRANSFMSKEAYDELSETGKEHPLHAHEITLRRAAFSVMRARSLVEAQKFIVSHKKHVTLLKCDGSFPDRCLICKSTDGVVISIEHASPLPPKDCKVEGCGMTFKFEIDWVADLV